MDHDMATPMTTAVRATTPPTTTAAASAISINNNDNNDNDNNSNNNNNNNISNVFNDIAWDRAAATTSIDSMRVLQNFKW
mmetsp:Transcript_16987/g.25149  ORF Transcript_16987/g.25149 Transcript_16987/m.25149 type:complete len:80 (-) Transcript_16987:73-312(-)